MQYTGEVWACYGLSVQAKHYLQRLVFILGLSRELIQFQHFYLFIYFVFLSFILFATYISAKRMQLQATLPGHGSLHLWLRPPLHDKVCTGLLQLSSAGVGILLNGCCPLFPTFQWRAILQENKQKHAGLFTSYGDRVEEQRGQSQCSSPESSSPSASSCPKISCSGMAERKLHCILSHLILSSALLGERGEGTQWDPRSCMGENRQSDLHSERAEIWMEVPGLGVLAWCRIGPCIPKFGSLADSFSSLEPLGFWALNSSLLNKATSSNIERKKHWRGRKGI